MGVKITGVRLSDVSKPSLKWGKIGWWRVDGRVRRAAEYGRERKKEDRGKRDIGAEERERERVFAEAWALKSLVFVCPMYLFSPRGVGNIRLGIEYAPYIHLRFDLPTFDFQTSVCHSFFLPRPHRELVRSHHQRSGFLCLC